MKQKTTTILGSANSHPSLFNNTPRQGDNSGKKRNTASRDSLMQIERSDEQELVSSYMRRNSVYLDPNEDRPE